MILTVEVPLMPCKIWVILADTNSWNQQQKPLEKWCLGDRDDPFLLRNGLVSGAMARGWACWADDLDDIYIYIQPWDSDRPQISERWQETYVQKTETATGRYRIEVHNYNMIYKIVDDL